MAAEYENEAELMRTCGHLYLSIALESLATTLMSLTFTYLLLLITSKGRLHNPGKAAATFLKSQFSSFYSSLYREVSHWQEMKELPLERRFALCRRANQAVCMLQIVIGMLTVERWLHINNVNGFRYLGYSLTCPPMQTELIILIAPVVPCYNFQCRLTYVVTTAMLLTGYAASVMGGELFDGSVEEFFRTGDMGGDLKPTARFWVTIASCAIQFYLTFLQIPYLALLYIIGGGVRGGLPHGYLKLLFIVAFTWLAFPIWWGFSYEGLSVIKDTKLNAVGFALLNIIAKGSFTLQMLSMTKWHRREKKRKECIEGGRPVRDAGRSGLFSTDSQAFALHPDAVQRRDSRAETWIVRMLRPYDKAGQSSLQWMALEPAFRAYLIGNGVTPNSWTHLSARQRSGFKESYDSTFNLVVGEGADGLHDKMYEPVGRCGGSNAALPVSDAPSPPPDRPAAGSEERPLDLEEGSACSSAGEPPSSSGRVEPPQAKAGPRVSQVVTTVHGARGRVLKIVGGDVQIAVPGKKPQTVRTDELTVLKVTFTGARGLRSVDPSGRLQLFCSALIDQCPSSEVQTAPRKVGGARVTWYDQVEVHGFSLGDLVTLRLWGRNQATKADEVLGEAKLASEELADDHYEGDLQLSLERSCTKTYLSVVLVAVNLPSNSADSNHDGDVPATPIGRPTDVHVCKNSSGSTVCCC